jgi:hypothetical protein
MLGFCGLRTVRVFGLLLALSSGGCASSPLVEAAERGDFAALKREIDAANRAGELPDDLVRDVADAVGRGEIERAKGDAGVAIVQGFAVCANELEGPLDDKSDGEGDVAAAAADVLMSAGLVDEDEYEDFALEMDRRPAFRALGARSLVDEDHAELRRKLFLDLDERVRLGALKAAMAAPLAADFDALLDAARLDPNPRARAAAARALGRLGGSRAVLALQDVWLRADGPLREAIVDAWASPASFKASGRDRLVVAAETGGEGSVAAAVLLSRTDGADARAKHAKDIGLGVLVRTIKQGTREDRGLAILMAPRSSLVLDAIREAKETGDPGVAVVALGRLAREGKPDEKKKSKDKLLEIAKDDDPESKRALGELALLGDKRATKLLDKELGSRSSYARAYAARAFVTLGDLQRAARGLADKEAHVRAGTACAILARDED